MKHHHHHRRHRLTSSPLLLDFLVLLALLTVGLGAQGAHGYESRRVAPRSLGGSFSTPVDNGNADACVEWSAKQNQTSATSIVSATFYIRKNADGAKAHTEAAAAAGALEIQIDGKKTFSGATPFDFRSRKVGDTDARVSVAEDVKHADSGIRAVQIAVDFDTKTSFGLISIRKTVFLDPITPKVSVTFYAEGAVVEKKSVTGGSIYGTLPTPTRPGYAFAGWFTEDGAKQVHSTSTVDGSAPEQKLYARWRLLSYTVSFNPNSGSCSGCSAAVKIALNESYGSRLPGNPSRSGYSFGGWYTGLANGERIEADTPFTALKDQVLHARWIPKNYTVTLKSYDGSTVSRLTVAYGGTYSDLPMRTRTGYTFDGWYTLASGGNKITEEVVFSRTSSQNLYEHWRNNTYTLMLNANRGHVSTPTKTVTYGNTYGTLKIPTRTGYTFNGWYTSASGGSEITETTTVSKAYSHTLYAQWTAKTYTVTFDGNGGSSTTSSKTVTYGESYGTLPTPTWSGYTFDGWYTSWYGGSEITGTTIVNIAKDHTLYAQWTAKTYTVTFDGNGVTVSQTTKTVTYGESYGTLEIPTRPGYTFDGWYTSWYGGSEITETTIVNIAKDHTLYAQWTAKTYTVTFEGNGGTVSQTRKTVTYGSTYGTLPTPTWSGYTFDGWYTTMTGGTRIYSDSEVNIAKDHTLYARWSNSYRSVDMREVPQPNITEEKEKVDNDISNQNIKSTTRREIDSDICTVCFNQNDGSTGGSCRNYTCQRSYSYSSTQGFPTPTRTGYTFKGWYTSASGGSKVTESGTVPGSSYALYAHWTANTYSVSFNAREITPNPSSITVTYGDFYGALPILSESGYRFGGWYKTATYSTKVSKFTTVNTNKNHALYARWYNNTYAIMWDSGSKVSKSTHGFGSAIQLQAPNRTGHVFRGWVDADDPSQYFNETTAPSRDLYLYADFEAVTYEVLLQSDAGAAVRLSEKYGTVAPLPGPLYQKAGHTFLGWADEGGKLWTDFFVVSRDSVLREEWERGVYAAVFATSSTTNTTQFLDYAAPIVPPEFARPKLFIERWCIREGEGEGEGENSENSEENCEDYLKEGDLMPARDVVLYAKWSEIPRTVEVSLGPCNSSEDLEVDAEWIRSAEGFSEVVSSACVGGEGTAVVGFSSAEDAEKFYMKYRPVNDMKYVNSHADVSGVSGISPAVLVIALIIVMFNK